MHEYAARQRKHLGLVLHTPERRREYHAVIITLEIGARMHPGVMILLQSETLARNQTGPAHRGGIAKGIHIAIITSPAKLIKKL